MTKIVPHILFAACTDRKAMKLKVLVKIIVTLCVIITGGGGGWLFTGITVFISNTILYQNSYVVFSDIGEW